jgi:hypothetical protein
VERLDDRLVPAVTLDLTAPGSSGSIGGAIFQ